MDPQGCMVKGHWRRHRSFAESRRSNISSRRACRTPCRATMLKVDREMAHPRTAAGSRRYWRHRSTGFPFFNSQFSVLNSRMAMNTRPSITILGVPFDKVTSSEALDRIDQMIASRKPHYLATANVDFLVQAREDVELRRILFDADLI